MECLVKAAHSTQLYKLECLLVLLVILSARIIALIVKNKIHYLKIYFNINVVVLY